MKVFDRLVKLKLTFRLWADSDPIIVFCFDILGKKLNSKFITNFDGENCLDFQPKLWSNSWTSLLKPKYEENLL